MSLFNTVREICVRLADTELELNL